MPDDFRLRSAVFNSGDPIPATHTCNGNNTSPPLAWSGVPEGVRSFALVMDDPDAVRKTFVHWIVYNLPPDVDTLPAGVDVSTYFDGRDPQPLEGVNDFGDFGYGGPCPPPGHGTHRYVIRLYALDTVLDLADGATKSQLTDAMQGHILAEANLIGTFERSA